MSKSSKNESPFFEIEKIFFEENKKLVSWKEWIFFSNSDESFWKAAKKNLPFDPRFNSVHWGFTVSSLCRQIAFGYCWMEAYASEYRKRVREGTQPANVDFRVSYFADNCITRIASCRDKLALMVWAFYCPFNPEKQVLNYYKVIEQLKYPLRFGLVLKKHDIFLRYLETLKGDDFDRIEKYRHYKIHRIEPRIEIYGSEPHHGWNYMFPLYEKKEIEEWENELQSRCPDVEHRERIKRSSYIKGVVFDKRRINGSIWDYTEISNHIVTSMKKLLNASAGCFKTLRRRAPLRKSS